MSFMCQVSRALDEEHRASLDLLARAEHAMARSGDAEWPALAARLVRHLEHEIGRHFDFEETRLFPHLVDSGDGGIAALLTDEHETIRAVAVELLPLLREAAAATHAVAGAPELRPLVFELVERQVSHIQKETMALLPLLDHLLDEDSDRELAFAYASD